MKTTLAKAVRDWTARDHQWPYATGPPVGCWRSCLAKPAGTCGAGFRHAAFPAALAIALTNGFAPLLLPQMKEPWL